MSILPHLDSWILEHTAFGTYQNWVDAMVNSKLSQLGFFCIYDPEPIYQC